MSGGFRVGSGRPQDPSALRTDRRIDSGAWLSLPRGGRQGPPPVWPLLRPTARELQLWAQDWKRPQAVMWEELHLEREVALYVRTFRDAEDPSATVARRVLVHRQMDSLGLTVAGMRACHWTLEEVPAPVARPAEPAHLSAKARLQLLMEPEGA